MGLALRADERAALARAEGAERRVRDWRRYRASRLLADGQGPAAAAAAVGCSERSVWYRAAAWRRGGLAGVGEGPHGGRARAPDGRAEGLLEARLGADPQARG
jgi:hypothetical protein